MSYYKIKTNIGNYSVRYQLGSGKFSDVYMAIHDKINLPVAIKRISKSQITTEKDKIRLNREINILKSAVHQYIIQFFEMIEDEENYYLIMELANNGSLKTVFNPNSPFSEDKCREIIREIVISIGYLHLQLNVVHRDLKLENILFGSDNHIRLIDFGLSNIFSKNSMHQTACGSPAYTAPEVLTRKKYTGAADIWSCGIILFLLSTGSFPFSDHSLPKLLNKICTEEVNFPSHLSYELRDLVSKMLEKDQNKRISILDILCHPWFNNSKELKKSPVNHNISCFQSLQDLPSYQICQEYKVHMTSENFETKNDKNYVSNNSINNASESNISVNKNSLSSYNGNNNNGNNNSENKCQNNFAITPSSNSESEEFYEFENSGNDQNQNDEANNNLHINEIPITPTSFNQRTICNNSTGKTSFSFNHKNFMRQNIKSNENSQTSLSLESDKFRPFIPRISMMGYDAKVAAILNEVGIDTSNIQNSLLKSVFDENTAAYRIVWRNKAIHELNDSRILEQTKNEAINLPRNFSCPTGIFDQQQSQDAQHYPLQNLRMVIKNTRQRIVQPRGRIFKKPSIHCPILPPLS
ncbi:hypothetical protein TRFO_20304 [Tritrichomonas foetus]|uniref:non-specific serine/threonine protein kinase n=1 Tax=Tritrichomonas foetus TaxID=1144522 RepID=A0A1J4KM24_9EUKA|nr:hypothetical protein TRFO_20304 [Tritrichomonas foetus]|eukprot:OHT10421.1 hypothetical protein TRFO_20304 [Tritrichomonas foetus]